MEFDSKASAVSADYYGRPRLVSPLRVWAIALPYLVLKQIPPNGAQACLLQPWKAKAQAQHWLTHRFAHGCVSMCATLDHKAVFGTAKVSTSSLCGLAAERPRAAAINPTF